MKWEESFYKSTDHLKTQTCSKQKEAICDLLTLTAYVRNIDSG